MSATATRLKAPLNVFISHAREDQPLAERIIRGLTFGGRVRVRTDRMLSAGEDWRSELKRALETTHVFIVIGSPAPARSDLVLQELGGAWALDKPIVVVTPEGEVEWAPPIEQSSYKRVALTELEQPAFAESLLTELTRHSLKEIER
jgi:TIR domain